jgi:hypothetical protein
MSQRQHLISEKQMNTHPTDAVSHSQLKDTGDSDAVSHKLLGEVNIHYAPQGQHAATETNSPVREMLNGFSLSEHHGNQTAASTARTEQVPTTPTEQPAPAPLTRADANFDLKFNEVFLDYLSGNTTTERFPAPETANEKQYVSHMFTKFTDAVTTAEQ